MKRSVFAMTAAGVGAAVASNASAAILYNTPGSTYEEDFKSLPSDRNDNQSIEVGNANTTVAYTDGWQDDVDWNTSPEDDVSVPGWHLRHPLDPGAAENGFNSHQRFRMGTGQNSGSFWGFAPTADLAEKALGNVGGTTVAGSGAFMYMGLQLINNTGQTLTQVTITYDGEQWRDGQSATGETMTVDYSLDATDANWFHQTTDPGATVPTFVAIPALSYTAPVTESTATNGANVDGNTAGRVPNITATLTDINWAPGQELWIRWGDTQLAGSGDDGLAIDEVRVQAFVPEPAGLALLALGAVGLIGRRRV